jgi:crossover junction endodeoxyribonuclease RuvC
MIIIGIDPGTAIIGFGVIENDKNKFKVLEYGTIQNNAKDQILTLKNTVIELSKLIDKYKPTGASIERLFFSNNQKTAMTVSENRGVILWTLANYGLDIQEYTPRQVKQTVCNYGLADKKQVQKMTKMILKIKEDIKPDDAADALALAICYNVIN